MLRFWGGCAVVLTLWYTAAQVTAQAMSDDALSIEDVRRPVYRGNIRYNFQFSNSLKKFRNNNEGNDSKYFSDIFLTDDVLNGENDKRYPTLGNLSNLSVIKIDENLQSKKTPISRDNKKLNDIQDDSWSLVDLVTDANQSLIVEKFIENSLSDLGGGKSESLDKLILSHTEPSDKHIQTYPEGSPPSWSNGHLRPNVILVEDVHPSKLPKPEYTQIPVYEQPSKPSVGYGSGYGTRPSEYPNPNKPTNVRPQVSKPSHYYGTPLTTKPSYHYETTIRPPVSKPSHYYEPNTKPPVTKPSHFYEPNTKPTVTKPSHYYEPNMKPPVTKPSHHYEPNSKPPVTIPSHYYEPNPKPTVTKPSHYYESNTKPSVTKPSHYYEPNTKPPVTKPSHYFELIINTNIHKPSYSHESAVKPSVLKPPHHYEHNVVSSVPEPLPNYEHHTRPPVSKPSNYYEPSSRPTTSKPSHYRPTSTKPSHYYEPSTKPPVTKPSHYYEPVTVITTKPPVEYVYPKPIVSKPFDLYPEPSKPTQKPFKPIKPSYFYPKPVTVKPAFENEPEPWSDRQPSIISTSHLPKPIIVQDVTPSYSKPPPEPPPSRPPPPAILVLESPVDNHVDCGTVQVINSASWKECSDVTVVLNAAAPPPETHAAIPAPPPPVPIVPALVPAAIAPLAPVVAGGGLSGANGLVPLPPAPIPSPPSAVIPVTEDIDDYEDDEEVSITPLSTTPAPKPSRHPSILSYLLSTMPFLGPITVSLWIIFLGPLSFIIIGILGVASFLFPWVAPTLIFGRFG